MQPPPPPPAPLDPSTIEPGRPEPSVPWTVRDLAITILGGGGVGLVLSAAFLFPLHLNGTNVSPAAELLVLTLAMYVPLCVFGWWFALKRHGATLADAGLRWVGIGPILLMIPATILLIVVTSLLSYLTGLVFGDVPTAQEQVLPGETSLPVIDLVWLVLAGAVAAPITEEFLFRGLIYRYLRATRPIYTAILVSSLLFAAAHFTPALVPVLLVFGIAEALVAERYDSLYPAMVLHALNNGTLFLSLYVVLN